MADLYRIMFTALSNAVADSLEDLAWGKSEQAETRLRMAQKMMEEISASWDGGEDDNADI